MGSENNGKYWYIIPDCRLTKALIENMSVNNEIFNIRVYIKDVELRHDLTSLNLSVFTVNNFHYFMNCENINPWRCTEQNFLIKWHMSFILVILFTCLRQVFFCYNLMKKYIKFPIPKMKLNRTVWVSLCTLCNKMLRWFRENCRF